MIQDIYVLLEIRVQKHRYHEPSETIRSALTSVDRSKHNQIRLVKIESDSIGNYRETIERNSLSGKF